MPMLTHQQSRREAHELEQRDRWVSLVSQVSWLSTGALSRLGNEISLITFRLWSPRFAIAEGSDLSSCQVARNTKENDRRDIANGVVFPFNKVRMGPS